MKLSYPVPIFIVCLWAGGCGDHRTYAERLNLQPLPTPRVLLPAGADTVAVYTIVELINQANTASQLSQVTAQLTLQRSLVDSMERRFKLTPVKRQRQKQGRAQFEVYCSFCERAAKIKAAEHEAGDKTDSTGEIAPLLASARQCFTNYLVLTTGLPRPY